METRKLKATFRRMNIFDNEDLGTPVDRKRKIMSDRYGDRDRFVRDKEVWKVITNQNGFIMVPME